jgi:hypothetical protein
MTKRKTQTKTEPTPTIEQILAALPTFKTDDLFALTQSIISHIRDRKTELDPLKLLGLASAAFYCFRDRTKDE